MIRIPVKAVALAVLGSGIVTTGLVLASGQGGLSSGRTLTDDEKAEIEENYQTAARYWADFHGRVQVAEFSAALDALEDHPENEAVTARLNKPFSLSFNDSTTLGDVLDRIRKATAEPDGKSLPIYVDPVGLKQVQATLKSPVTIDLQGIPLRTSLRLVLKQVRLAYCVRDGLLIISSLPGIRMELSEALGEVLGKNPDEHPQIMQSLKSQSNGMGVMGGGMGGVGGGMMGGGMGMM